MGYILLCRSLPHLSVVPMLLLSCLLMSLLYLTYLLLPLLLDGSPAYTSCLAIDHSDLYYTNHSICIFTQCINITQHLLENWEAFKNIFLGGGKKSFTKST